MVALSPAMRSGRLHCDSGDVPMSAPTTPTRAKAKGESPLRPNTELERFMQGVVARDPDQPEFHQAVREVAESVMPLVLDDRRYRDAKILERMSEPDRIITFRVAWE